MTELKRRETERKVAEANQPDRGGHPTRPVVGRPTLDVELARAEEAVRVANEAAEKKRVAKAEHYARTGKKIGGRVNAQDKAQRAAQNRLEKVLERQKLRQPAKPSPEYANTTDPESRLMKTTQGWVQGYNAQAAVNEAGIVIAAEVTQQVSDFQQWKPMMAAIRRNLDQARQPDLSVDLALLDAGYFSNENLTAPGPDRLIATGKARTVNQQPTTRGEPPTDSTPAQAMSHRLRTPSGRSTYKLRGQLVEPYFGNIKEVKGFRRFIGRGLKNVESEWKLIATTNNLLKLFTNLNPAT